jgi:hypothetical protein
MQHGLEDLGSDLGGRAEGTVRLKWLNDAPLDRLKNPGLCDPS